MKHQNQNPPPNHVSEGIYYCSPDAQFAVAIKIASAKRYPRHDYPICVIRLVPKKGTRVQSLEGPEGGVEYLAPFNELRRWLEIVALADPKFAFWLSKSAQPKPARRKEYWRRQNERRFGPFRGGK